MPGQARSHSICGKATQRHMTPELDTFSTRGYIPGTRGRSKLADVSWGTPPRTVE